MGRSAKSPMSPPAMPTGLLLLYAYASDLRLNLRRTQNVSFESDEKRPAHITKSHRVLRYAPNDDGKVSYRPLESYFV
ncbi:hypothetical protein Trydic_g1880 [Trypoxylus dichotomus]